MAWMHRLEPPAAYRVCAPKTAPAFSSLRAMMPSGVKQIVSAVYLRDVQRLAAQRAAALVAGHMQPHGPAAGVAADEIADGGAHSVLQLTGHRHGDGALHALAEQVAAVGV